MGLLKALDLSSKPGWREILKIWIALTYKDLFWDNHPLYGGTPYSVLRCRRFLRNP